MRWRRICCQACAVLIAIGIVLQWTVRDWLPFPIAGWYYALPRPLLAVLALVGVASARGAWRWAFLPLLPCFIVWVAARDIAWNAARDAGSPTERVVFWNVGHDLMDDVDLVDRFLGTDPLVIGLVETGWLDPAWLDSWRLRHADYRLVQPHPTILLAVRGTVTDQGYALIGHNSHAAWVDFETGGEPVRAVVVDIAANPWISRRKPLANLSALLDSWSDRRIVLMGDFNTPDDSVWFTDIRAQFVEAFRAAGNGYVPTWPWPAPVLKLDQIWVSRSIPVRRGWQTGTWRSDHRAQWAELSLRE